MSIQMRRVFVASVPAALIGIWNLGRQIAAASFDVVLPWQLAMLDYAGIRHGDPRVLPTMLTGLAFFVPLLVTSVAASWCWAAVFARLRQRPFDAGWFLAAWLYALLLPATIPVSYAALGISFGLVFGSHVFGGTARSLVGPALLGLVFLGLAYPALSAAWLPVAEPVSTWSAVAGSGFASGLEPLRAFWPVFFGLEIGAVGTTSALACLLGVAYLIAVGAASASVVLAALAGLVVGASLVGEIPAHWHLGLGNFAFLLAFLARESALGPRTRAGAVAYGALFGLLTVVIRMASPEHPEGSAFALLLAMLAIPLLDYTSVALRLRRLPDSEAADRDAA